MVHPVTCPVCGQSEPVDKVSTIYLTGIEMRKPSAEADAISALSRKLAPPSSGKQAPTRPIHPDMAVLAFSAIAPIFVYGILTSQANMLLPVTGLLLGFYVFYFWQRKRLIAKFEAEKAKQRTAEQRVRRSIERWMNLCYCAEDEGVFEPGSNGLVPIDQMMGYLLQDP